MANEQIKNISGQIYLDSLNNFLNNENLTFDLFFNWFSWVQPVTDMVVVCVLKTKVIFLNDIHLVMDLLQQLLARSFFLQQSYN